MLRQCLDLSQLETAKETDSLKETLASSFDYYLESPYDLITDLGISSLSHTYIFLLVSQNLCTWTDLACFFDTSLEIDEQITNLGRIQSVLECITMITTNLLSIPFETLRKLVKELLRYYNPQNDVKDYLRIRVGLPRFNRSTAKIVESVSSVEPREWGLIFGEDMHLATRVDDNLGDFDQDGSWKLQICRSYKL